MPTTVYRDAALADGRSSRLRVEVSVLTHDGRVRWIRPTSEEGDLPAGCEVVDAGGTTIVPGLVDGHSHLTMPAGSHWIARGADPTETLETVPVSLLISNIVGDIKYSDGCRSDPRP